MAWIQVHGESACVGMNVAFHALIPQYDPTGQHGPAQKGPYKVIYLLHGYSDNSAHWLRMTAIERELVRQPVAVILPETDNAFWLNTHTGWNYFDYLTQELPALCKNLFPVSDRREDTMIAGFSMGGYGALHAALNKPEQYGFCAAFAPAVELWTLLERQDWPMKVQWLVGDRESFLKSDENLYCALEKQQTQTMAKMKITVGESDVLKDQSDRLVQKMAQLHLPVDYEPVPGNHDWYFAEAAFLRALNWFQKGGR